MDTLECSDSTPLSCIPGAVAEPTPVHESGLESPHSRNIPRATR